ATALLAATALLFATLSRGATTTPKDAAAVVAPALVNINTNLAYQGASAAGTGIVLTSDGTVVTNNHVIRGATTIRATDVGHRRRERQALQGARRRLRRRERHRSAQAPERLRAQGRQARRREQGPRRRRGHGGGERRRRRRHAELRDRHDHRPQPLDHRERR